LHEFFFTPKNLHFDKKPNILIRDKLLLVANNALFKTPKVSVKSQHFKNVEFLAASKEFFQS
jgi:hypothetical protein